MKKVVLLISVSVFICLHETAQANDTAYWGDGATVFAVKDNRIIMESEKSTITHNPEQGYKKKWAADCLFSFLNKTEKEIEIQMGFPDWNLQESLLEDQPVWAIFDFSITVDGKNVSAVHKLVDNSDQPSSKHPQKIKMKYDAAYTWKVTFPPRGRVVVRNRYRFGGLTTVAGLNTCTRGMKKGAIESLFWKQAKSEQWDTFFNNANCNQVMYIVTTGRSWSGNIGSADVSIQMPPDTFPHTFIPSIPTTSVSDGWIRWHFNNWIPREEISVTFYSLPISQLDFQSRNPSIVPTRGEEKYGLPLFDSAKQARAWVGFARRNNIGIDQVAQLIKLCESCYSRDLRFQEKEFLEKVGWYLYCDNLKDSRMSKTENQVLSILKRFEANLKKKDNKRVEKDGK